MKYLLIILMICHLYINQVSASTCVLNCSNNEIILDRNMYDTQSVASISKLMTAVIVMENVSLNEMIVVDSEVTNIEGSSIYLKEGDVYSVRSLLYGLMLRSGNDAAYALAKYVGNGSIEYFVELMNKKAKELNMAYTIFENPCGLELPNGNISNAYDMSLLMCYASLNKELMEILSCKQYKINNSVWSNKNKLLSMSNYVLGGKTGFTKKAGRTLVSIGGADNLSIVVTTLKQADDFNYHKNIYNSLFESYKRYLVIKEGRYYFNDYFVDMKDINVLSNNINNESIEITYDTNYLYVKLSNREYKFPIYRR